MDNLTSENMLRWGIFLFIIVIFLIPAVVAFVNIFDMKVDAFGINPNEQLHHSVIRFQYPAELSQYPKVDIGAGKRPTYLPLFNVDICLEYVGTLVEGKEVTVRAYGRAYPEGRKVLQSAAIFDSSGIQTDFFNHSVDVGFVGASLYNESSAVFISPGGQFPVNLMPADEFNVATSRSSSTWAIYQFIKWDNQGYYYPYIHIDFSNGTSVTYPYPEYTIYVGGDNEIRQERYARISTSLTIVLFFFTLVTSIGILGKFFPNKKWLIWLIGEKDSDKEHSKKTENPNSNNNIIPSPENHSHDNITTPPKIDNSLTKENRKIVKKTKKPRRGRRF